MKIQLPPDSLNPMRDELWKELRQPDRAASEAAYARLLQNISLPTSSEFLRHVPGCAARQIALNCIIIWWRMTPTLLIYPLVVVLAIWKSAWLLLAIPLLWTGNLMLNRVQTALNVELAARLYVLHNLLDHDEALRNRLCAASDADMK